MAKNNEFKPDKLKSSFFSKLYLTKKQRINILRWTLQSLLLLALSVLQDALLCRLRVFGATTDLVPCGIFLVCILSGMHRGCIFSLIASVLYLFSGSAPGPYAIALIVIISVFAAYFRQSFLQKGFGATIFCMTLAVVIYELTVFFVSLVTGLTVWSRISFAGVTIGLTLLTVPVLYPAVKVIDSIGGELWRE